jgi:tRNA(adenine34) deaminase
LPNGSVDTAEMDDAALMELALAEAQRGLDSGELPVGAVVALAGEAIAAAHTRERSAGRLLVHAELLALEQADQDPRVSGRRRELTLVTTVEPCPMCLGAALAAQVGRVVYALASPTDGAHKLFAGWRPALPGFASVALPQVVAGVDAAGSRALIAEFVAREQGAFAVWAASLLA